MIPPPADDAAIIEESRERPEVFAHLYDRHAADIHRYVARRLGDGVADDITAETFRRGTGRSRFSRRSRQLPLLAG